MTPQPTSSSYDAIVIGGGHNGLAAAALLARAQQRVLLVERRPTLGGATAGETPFPGFHGDAGPLDAGLFLPQVIEALDLPNHGLRFLENPALLHAPQHDGTALTLWRNVTRTQDEIARFSEADARRYPEFLRRVNRAAAVLDEIRRLPPPNLPDLHPGELLPWLRPALDARRLGGDELMDFIRILPMPLADFLDEWFESPALKGALGAAGVAGLFGGPRSGGTTFLFLYHAIGGAPRAMRIVAGGSGALIDALARAARRFGVEICAGVGVQRILLEDQRAAGVLLDDGRSVRARRVLSSADPRRTFFDLLGAPELEVNFVRDVRALRLRATTARLHLALSGLPRFPAASPEALSGHIVVAPTLDDIERAFDDAKYGQFSQRPLLDLTIPTLLDPTRAPAGMHLMSVGIQYTPNEIQGGWDARRDALQEAALARLEAFAPGLRSLVAQAHLVTPADLERDYALTGGDIHHGQMGLDQLLFMRPVAGWGRYATPIPGLYLCGAGAHPGGGLTAAPAWNAVGVILKERPPGAHE